MSCSLLIPAAGYGGRFSELTTLPKALIKFRWHGSEQRTMLEHSAQLEPNSGPFAEMLTMCQTRHGMLFRDRVPTRLEGIDNSISQADTVMRGMALLNPANDVVVVNCDNGIRFPYSTFIEVCRALRVDCGLLSVEVDGGAYGYLDKIPFFNHAVESKQHNSLISSRYIIAGAFYFRRPHTYLDCYDPEYRSVSECFPHVGKRYALPIPRDRLHAWAGTRELIEDTSVSDISL